MVRLHRNVCRARVAHPMVKAGRHAPPCMHGRASSGGFMKARSRHMAVQGKQGKADTL